MTQSQKYTLKNLKDEETDWKELILLNEVTLLRHFSEVGLHYAYHEAEHNAWIVKTLVDKKQRYKFETCKSIVLVGCGLYPYSMFDLHKQYPHINSVGVEIDDKRCKIAEALVNASPGKDSIKIVNCDGMDYDFTWLGIDDFVFVSVDVEKEKDIQQKVIMTSKASPFLCAPYHTAWREAFLS